jgi:hypothetical protein
MSKNRIESPRLVATVISVMVVFFASACVEAPSDKSNNNRRVQAAYESAFRWIR